MSCGCPGPSPIYPVIPVAPAMPAFGPPTGIPGGSSSPSSGSSTTPTCPEWLTTPVTSEVFVAPAPGAQGQLKTQCAYKWVVSGAVLHILPFGSVTVTGVAGDLVTFQNINIPGGSNIIMGTQLIQGPPQAAVADIAGDALDTVRGFYDGVQKYIPGTANTLLRFNQIGTRVAVQPVSGRIFTPNPASNVEVGAKDIGGAAINTTPLATAGTGSTVYYDLNNLPASNLLPSQFFALIHFRMSCVNLRVPPDSLAVKHNSVEIADIGYDRCKHGECLVPVTGTKLQLDLTKLTGDNDVYFRLRVIGYYF